MTVVVEDIAGLTNQDPQPLPDVAQPRRARPLVAIGYGPRCVPVMQLAETASVSVISSGLLTVRFQRWLR